MSGPPDATPEILEAVFGQSTGATPEERARTSKRVFVRGLDQLSKDAPRATGRRLTAIEAFWNFGWDALATVASEGTVSIPLWGKPLRERREELGLLIKQVAYRAGVAPEIVESAEQSKRVPIRDYEKIARALGLDDVNPEMTSTQSVALRLRALKDDLPYLSAPIVTAVAEAVWVATTQAKLEKHLEIPLRWELPPKSSQYGGPGYPAYLHGYWLATELRKRLNEGEDALTLSLREIAEGFGIPVIQTELGDAIAGLTVGAGGVRAIVINTGGENRKIFVHRSTLAHELGHLLFDPDQRLLALRVDSFDELGLPREEHVDFVEQRANAFAAEFLIPQRTLVGIFEEAGSEGVRMAASRFGVSPTLARYQTWNAIDRRIPLEKVCSVAGVRPDSHWDGMERYTTEFHPLSRLRPSRAGRFSGLTVAAATRGFISWDTAAAWLESSEHEVRQAAPDILDLFPSLRPFAS